MVICLVFVCLLIACDFNSWYFYLVIGFDSYYYSDIRVLLYCVKFVELVFGFGVFICLLVCCVGWCLRFLFWFLSFCVLLDCCVCFAWLFVELAVLSDCVGWLVSLFCYLVFVSLLDFIWFWLRGVCWNWVLLFRFILGCWLFCWVGTLALFMLIYLFWG